MKKHNRKLRAGLDALSRVANRGPLDLAVGLILFSLFMIGSIAFIGVFLVEAMVMRLMRWGSLARCLWHSLAMNIVSTFVGIVFAYLRASSIGALGWIALFVGSIAIEGFLLTKLSPGRSRRAWFVAVVANSVSYALLLLAFLLFA